MFNLPFRNRRSPIALDIGSEGVKMLQLQQAGRGIVACASARWDFPHNLEDPQQRREQMVAAVRNILRKGQFKGRNAVTSLSCSQLAIKNIRLPHMSSEELSQAVRFEAAERFGYNVEPDQLSYLSAGQVRQGNEVQDEIIMMAVSPQTIQDHLDLLGEMGLHAMHIDAEPVALFRTFERFLRRREDETAVTVIIDVGVASTRVVVARGRQIVFIKSIDIGGRKLTESVAKQLNLSYTEACEMRMMMMREGAGGSTARPADASSQGQAASASSWTIHDAIRSDVEELAREVSLCLRYCSVTFRGLRAEKVILTGGQAYDPMLVEQLGKQLNMECIVGRPLQGIDVSNISFDGDRRGLLAEWSICTGLGIHGMNIDNTLEEIHHGERRVSA